MAPFLAQKNPSVNPRLPMPARGSAGSSPVSPSGGGHGRSPYKIRVTRSDGTTENCGHASFELRSLTWAAEGANSRAIPSVTNVGSGYRLACGTAIDLPRTCARSGWADDTVRTGLGSDDCAGETFFSMDIGPCSPQAVLTLTAEWLIIPSRAMSGVA